MPTANTNTEDEIIHHKLVNSLLYFTQIFYKIRTGRKFELSYPDGRESHFVTICKELVKVFDGQTKKLIINVPPRYGKAICVETPMLTSNGWTTAGNIKEGDYIVGSKGFVRVNGVYPQGKLSAKEVFFSDNQSVSCNAEHLWNVKNRYSPNWKTLTTLEIEDTIYEYDGRKNWKIPLVNGNFDNEIPFMDPYLLGCWLGDGHSHYSAITTMDAEIVKAFVDKGHEMRLHTHQNAGKAKTYGITNNNFSSQLKENNLLKNKHIPYECYLWPKKDRLALLQGLMDTDGTCGKNGQVSFTNKNESIIKGAGYLVNSLGGIYKTYTRQSGIKTLNIRLPDELSPFRLERKRTLIHGGIKCSPRRYIESIIDIDPREMVCFSVDAEDKLFAVGEGLILTHNTELVIHFVAWAMAQYPDSNFVYISYAHSLAKKQTQTIRNILQLREYQDMFGLGIKDDSSAKDNFETNKGGSVYAAGAGGPITGRGPGIKGVNRFGGAGIIDDIHKPNEAYSEVIRSSVHDWYYDTYFSRPNSNTTPTILIGQRVHEDDIVSHLLKEGDWKLVEIRAMDEAGNALYPEMHDVEALKKMERISPYVFWAQYQQSPQPDGGGIFKPEWFVLHDEEPDIIATFITCDSAETEKSYNDATVFSFWGIYKIKIKDIETEAYGLHWLDCWELRIEPKDIENEFLNFYAICKQHRVKPSIAAIEKKSTGVTLISTLKGYQGLRIIEIERTRLSGSKIDRFIEAQSYVASRLISLPTYGRHTDMCIKHCKGITANNSHRFDDIADTMYDAIKIGLIDKTIINIQVDEESNYNVIARSIMGTSNRIDQLKKKAYS